MRVCLRSDAADCQFLSVWVKIFTSDAQRAVKSYFTHAFFSRLATSLEALVDTSPIPLELRGRVGLHHWLLAPESRFLNHGSYGARLRRTVACQHRLAAAVESDPMRMLTDQLESKLHEARCGMAAAWGRSRRFGLL